jgi:hypothetical protein
MATVHFEGKDYDIDLMSDLAKSQLGSIQFVDAELQRKAAQTAVLHAARAAYINSLRAELGNLGSDTLKLD